MSDITKKDPPPFPTKLDFSSMRQGIGLPGMNLSSPSSQIQFMFDLTVSMFSCFEIVRQKLTEIIDDVSKYSPGVEFAVSAYRNHGDENNYEQIVYLTKLSNDVQELHKAISKIKKGGGGNDALTCMEDALHETNKQAWNSKCAKSLVIIGDMPPHGVIDKKDKCPNKIDYEIELAGLREKKIKIYSVFCGHNPQVKTFYEKIANDSGGKFLQIAEIDILVDLLKGICLKGNNKLTVFLKENEKMLPTRTARLLLDLDKQ